MMYMWDRRRGRCVCTRCVCEVVLPGWFGHLAHKLRLRRMAGDAIPRDKSWQVLVPLSIIWTVIAVLFVRWWLCV